MKTLQFCAVISLPDILPGYGLNMLENCLFYGIKNVCLYCFFLSCFCHCCLFKYICEQEMWAKAGVCQHCIFKVDVWTNYIISIIILFYSFRTLNNISMRWCVLVHSESILPWRAFRSIFISTSHQTVCAYICFCNKSMWASPKVRLVWVITLWYPERISEWNNVGVCVNIRSAYDGCNPATGCEHFQSQLHWPDAF